jgi:hypothetical protein
MIACLLCQVVLLEGWLHTCLLACMNGWLELFWLTALSDCLHDFPFIQAVVILLEIY